jgi:chromosome segregation ATPase
VNLIQNSSQDLAEFKERIKMLQSELEILKNESAEKNRTILEYNRQFQLEKHKRDQTKAKLNKYEFENKEKQALVDQNIKEIEKLNTIMQSLQKDMEELRSSYEVVCENRNYTGIQLIDRNDELCILYEKSNMQEIILRKEELAVKSLEDEIRMISIEVGETERKIKVARDKILVVPKLA